MSQQMATHAGRTTCQNKIRNPSSKAGWEVQNPKPIERSKFHNPNSKAQVPKPKFRKSKSTKWVAALLLPLGLLLRGSATATATGATVVLHATTQTRGEPRLASTKLTFQKRFDRKLYSVAVSQHVPPQSRRRENHSIASCAASRRAGVGLTSYRGSPCKVHSLSKRVGADR